MLYFVFLDKICKIHIKIVEKPKENWDTYVESILERRGLQKNSLSYKAI